MMLLSAWRIVGVVALLGGTISDTAEKAAVEAVIRESEQAFAALDCEKVDSSLAPGARWIEKSYPQPAETAAWCAKAKAAGIRITYELHDFDVQVHGDFAWATLVIDGSFYAGTPAARALMGHEPTDAAEWRSVAAESIVLRKIGTKWKMVLGHSSLIQTGR
jgi:ketosteroid isomerase-like protein